jgi:hypothetical protein
LRLRYLGIEAFGETALQHALVEGAQAVGGVGGSMRLSELKFIWFR